jgi:N-acetylneuraminic acid mutarotase
MSEFSRTARRARFGITAGTLAAFMFAALVLGTSRPAHAGLFSLFSRLSLSATSLSFSPEPIGLSSAPQVLTLTNRGSETVKVNVAVSGSFGVTDACGTLTPGASCNLDVIFSPLEPGDQSGVIVIHPTDHDFADLFSFQFVSLTGAGFINLAGEVLEGPIGGATVTAWTLDPASGSKIAKLGSATSDSTGNFGIDIFRRPDPKRPVLLAADSGSFASEEDGTTIDIPPGDEEDALLPPVDDNVTGISVNPLSTFVYSRAAGRLALGDNPDLLTALGAARVDIEDDFALSTDPATLVPDYTTGDLDSDAGKLGLILGALVTEDETHCPAPATGGLVAALAADIGDNVFDGIDVNKASVPYCGGNLPAIAGISIFDDALSGLEQLDLATEAFDFGDFGPPLNILFLNHDTASPDLLAGISQIETALSATAPASVDDFASTRPADSDLHAGREFATATTLPNGNVLIAGGDDANGHYLKSAEIYDPATDTVTPSKATLSSGRNADTATLLPNGQVLIAGGFDGTNFLQDVELYDPASDSFDDLGNCLNNGRNDHTATLLPTGQVLIAGGYNPFGGFLQSAELYDPSSKTCTLLASKLNNGRNAQTATLLPSGKVLIVGGDGPFGLLNTAELYDPASRTFKLSAGTLASGRNDQTATLLPSGKVLIAGGFDGTNYLQDAELYDPSSDSFKDLGPILNNGRSAQDAALLPNGKVVVLGGAGPFGPESSGEVFDPTAQTFSLVPTELIDAREFADAALLANGKVVVVGGQGTDDSVPTETELYTP